MQKRAQTVTFWVGLVLMVIVILGILVIVGRNSETMQKLTEFFFGCLGGECS